MINKFKAHLADTLKKKILTVVQFFVYLFTTEISVYVFNKNLA